MSSDGRPYDHYLRYSVYLVTFRPTEERVGPNDDHSEVVFPTISQTASYQVRGGTEGFNKRNWRLEADWRICQPLFHDLECDGDGFGKSTTLSIWKARSTVTMAQSNGSIIDVASLQDVLPDLGNLTEHFDAYGARSRYDPVNITSLLNFNYVVINPNDSIPQQERFWKLLFHLSPTSCVELLRLMDSNWGWVVCISRSKFGSRDVAIVNQSQMLSNPVWIANSTALFGSIIIVCVINLCLFQRQLIPSMRISWDYVPLSGLGDAREKLGDSHIEEPENGRRTNK